MHRLLLFLTLFSVGYVQAQHKPLDAVTIKQIKEGVSDVALKTSTISSDFTQEKEMSILNDKIITSGRFFYKKERLLRWEYIHPFSYIITIQGDDITIKDEEGIKSFNTGSNKVFSEVNRIIIGSINGTLLDDVSFTADYDQNNGHYIVSLSPVSVFVKENLKRIAIYFNKKDYTVDRLEMFESAGDFTRITFINKQINQPISDEIFILH